MLTVSIIANPLLLLLLLLLFLPSVPFRPPPGRASDTEVDNSNRQNNNRIPRIIRRIAGEVKPQPTVYHAE
jgi:hypothetical protein